MTQHKNTNNISFVYALNTGNGEFGDSAIILYFFSVVA